MKIHIMLPADLEPEIHRWAFEAARNSALADLPSKVVNAPGPSPFDRDGGKRFQIWRGERTAEFLRFRRLLKDCGVDYECPDNRAFMGTYYPPKPNTGTKYVQDKKRPYPNYIGGKATAEFNRCAEIVAARFRALHMKAEAVS